MPLTLLESYGLGLFSLGGYTAEEQIKQVQINKLTSIHWRYGSLKFGYQSTVLSGIFYSWN